MNFISNVLAPTDCSEASIDALNYSIKIAKRYHAKLMVLYVISHVKKAASHTLSEKSPYNFKDQFSGTKNQLEEFWRSIGENGIKADLVLGYGDPFAEIMSFAKSKKNDIIVMGTRGRTGLAHLLMGSIAEKVVRYSHIPVVTVKHESYESFPKHDYDYDFHKRY